MEPEAASGGSAVIEFRGVTKRFGSHVVLDNLDLHVPRNKITFIVGKSGEGKSVTIKHIMGLLHPDSGTIIVEDHDITGLSHDSLREYRRRFGMLFQHAALFDSMTVFDNIAFPLREQRTLRPDQITVRVGQLLRQVGLPGIEEKFPNQLSTGEKKRVGLARALSAAPRILLYDEPTTGMDPLVSEMIDDLIVRTSHETPDLTSIVISHDLKAALATADHIIMLYKGKVILAGDPEMFRTSSDACVRQFFSGKVEGPMEFL